MFAFGAHWKTGNKIERPTNNTWNTFSTLCAVRCVCVCVYGAAVALFKVIPFDSFFKISKEYHMHAHTYAEHYTDVAIVRPLFDRHHGPASIMQEFKDLFKKLNIGHAPNVFAFFICLTQWRLCFAAPYRLRSVYGWLLTATVPHSANQHFLIKVTGTTMAVTPTATITVSPMVTIVAWNQKNAWLESAVCRL